MCPQWPFRLSTGAQARCFESDVILWCFVPGKLCHELLHEYRSVWNLWEERREYLDSSNTVGTEGQSKRRLAGKVLFKQVGLPITMVNSSLHSFIYFGVTDTPAALSACSPPSLSVCLSLSLSHTHTHTHFLSLTHSLTHTHTHTHSHTHTHTHIHTHTHTHTHTHRHTDTYSCWHFHGHIY